MPDGAKYRLFTAFAGVAKAMGHPNRLVLLEQIAQCEQPVETAAARAGLSVANASQHLQSLRRAGLVASRRHGKNVLYRLADDGVLDLFAALRDVAERNLAEIDRVVESFFDRRDDLEPVSRETLLQRVRDGSVSVLDVRPEDEFAGGRLPGAINIPLEALESRLAELDPAKDIVAYCRGKYCVFSFEAVALLREQGFTAHRLEDGFPEWRAAGLAVEAG